MIKSLSGELHLFKFPETGEVLTSIIDSSWKDLKEVCEFLWDMFVNLYLECDTGRKKFSRWLSGEKY